MKATIIRISIKGGSFEYPGWIVPNTEDLFAVDQRVEADLDAIPPEPAEWAITHRPSGFRVSCGDYTSASTREQAFRIAQRFYDETKWRGWDLLATEGALVTAKYKGMSKDEARAFWYAVADWDLAGAKEPA